jgi:hypothetical protein
VFYTTVDNAHVVIPMGVTMGHVWLSTGKIFLPPDAPDCRREVRQGTKSVFGDYMFLTNQACVAAISALLSSFN